MFVSLSKWIKIKHLLNTHNIRNLCTNKQDDKSPLSGIRVLDLTRIIAGPYCTMILGDLGAEILKVEKPGSGDEARKWGPPFMQGTEEATYFLSVNRNKKSICINLKEGRHIIYELAKKSDILVENYIPGALKKMGLGYEDISKVAPHLIYCSLTGYGYEGPYTNRPGYDVIAASIGGLLNITGPKGGPPCKVGVAMTDLATGLYAHGAILAALYQRIATKKGQWIQCNLLATQVASLINVGSNYLNANEEAVCWGSGHASIVPYEAFQTKDGYITVGTGSDIQFLDLLKRMQLTELSKIDKYKNNKNRVKYRDELVPILRKKFKSKASKDWEIAFEGASFPYGPINTIKQVFEDPHVKYMKMVQELEDSIGRKVKVVGPAVTYNYATNKVRSAPPMLGQHTTEILKNILNYTDDKIETLKKTKIVQ